MSNLPSYVNQKEGLFKDEFNCSIINNDWSLPFYSEITARSFRREDKI